MQSLSKNYQSVEESKNIFENSRLYLERATKANQKAQTPEKIVTSAEKNQHLKENKNIWRTSNLNYILNGIQHSKQNSDATWKPNGKYHSATTVERRTQCARLLRAQHHQNAFKTMMRCYVREVRQKLRKNVHDTLGVFSLPPPFPLVI